MTKGTKVILIIGIACIVASLIIFGIALWLGGARFAEGMDTRLFGVNIHMGKDGFYTGGAYTEEVTVGEYIADETITALDVNWTSGDVYFVVGGDVLTATETYSGELSENQQMACSVVNGTLKIEYNYGKTSIVNINETVGGKVLTVTIPEHMVSDIDSISVDTTSADVTIGGFEPDVLKIHSTSGDSWVSDMSAGSFVFEATSGCLTVENGAFGKAFVDVVSGNAALTNVSAGEFSFEGTSACLRAEECSFGSVDADNGSGDIYISLNSMPREIDAETTSGEVELYLPKDAEFTLEFDRTSGDLELDFAAVMRGDEFVVGNGRNEISIETTSGDVFIRVK